MGETKALSLTLARKIVLGKQFPYITEALPQL
jgi:hypothetical protein